MTKTFKIGNHVSWNSEAGRVRGRIVRVHRNDVNYKGYVHHASPDEPQYEIKSDKTDHIALHYADYAMSERFRLALAHLRERGRTQRCAIMCAETVWWRCHRRIITDYLLAAGETVFHIFGPRQVELAAVNEAAQVLGAGTLVYPAEASSQRDLFGQ